MTLRVCEGLEMKKKRVRPLGDSLLVGGDVYVVRGRIIDNPFAKKIENSEAAIWMVTNRTRVEKSIRSKFMENRVIGGNVDDCFNMMLNEFNMRLDLQFNKNYFGKGTGYSIEDYVINRVKHMVLRYKNSLNAEGAIHFLTSDEATNFSYGVVDELIGGQGRVEDILEEDNVYWDTLFNDLLYHLDEFLDERNYRDFPRELLISYLYFDAEGFGDHGDPLKHFKRVAEMINESVDVVTTVVGDMQKSVRDGELHGKEILRIVQELLEGKKHGWKPEVLRKKD